MEDLSEMLEKPIEAENIPSLRQHVTDKTVSAFISVCGWPKAEGFFQVYVQKRNGIMLQDTAQGFLEGRWKWNCSVEGFD